ncbi:MAG: IPT/TIG domain-containing protein, partial [bacterium]|nr:IPT/TIG domain-containing protein [bacterium]
MGLGLWAAPAALAQVNTGLEFGTASGLSTQDIRVTIAKIIRGFLGLLGVIGLGVVLAGGFLWMTSGGNEEKVEKAKKLLTNGAIGLTIVLLSFSITQFVLSRLTDALNASRVEVATEGGGGGVLPPGALPGGCADPGGAEPFVCSVTPQQATVGSFVSIRGYRFSEFVAGTSEIRIGNVVATIASCEGSPSWTDNTVIAVVPTLATGTQHGVLLTAGSGVGARNTYAITVIDGVPAPGIACIIPKQSPTGQNVAIWGQGFGADRGTSSVTFGGGAVADTFASWMDTQVQTPVPAAATSGEVTAAVGAVTSNGYPFTVTCGVPEQCASSCCVEGQCVDAAACAPAGPPAGAVEGPVITSVSPQTLVHPTEGTSYRRPEDVPEGVQAVVAPNGASGNYLTIRGRGFGALPGRVVLLGGEGAADDVVASAPAACAAAWSDEQVIVTVPVGAAIGPMRIEVGDPMLADQTDDAKGTAIEHFRPNTTQRPGLCAIDPGQATLGAAVAIAGVQFGAARGADDAVLFGDVSSGTTSIWGIAAITTTVPNIAEGAAEVRVRVDGELSNAVGFSRAPEPRVPRIRDIMPASGGPGQYVTLRGEYFGSTIGKVTFTRGDDEYEVVPRFPEQCRQEWWRESEITVRVPANTGEWGPPAPPGDFNALGSYEVRVHAREGNALRASNATAFTVTADQPTPGICAITPSSGPARTPVRILGERFGGAEGVIRFFDGVALGDADTSTFQWLPGEVGGILVPGTAKTGPVRLWQAGQDADLDTDAAAPGLQGNKGSNPVTFDVRDCRTGGDASCTAGQICCGNGTCVARAQDCGVGPTAGSYQWTFATGVIPKVPRVVESCTPTDPSVIPSPSPWDQQGLGQQACVNANIAIRFTTSMALDEATAASGIQVYQCGGGTNVASSSGGFEGGALPAGWTIVDGERLTASAETVVASAAHGGTGVLRLTKRVPSVADQPRTTDLPRDAPVDRHYFAITAPATLIADTNGTTYTTRVFVKGANPNQNPNMRAGIVVGRLGGAQPADAGWWQQAANEVTIDGTWQELAASISFDAGPNTSAPGFVRLYVTGPPRDAPANPDDTYAVEFDDLDVVRAGDACATREALDGLMVRVGSEGGRLQLADNIISVDAPAAGWSRGTWYEVIAFGTNESVTVGGVPVEKVALQSAGAAALRLDLDGDKDGDEGGNYRFRFHTRDSAEPCAIQHVALAPHDAVATRRGPAEAGGLAGRQNAADSGLIHLRADGIGDPAACFTLATSGMGWGWTAEQPVAPPTVPSGGYASVGNGGRWCVTSDECAVVTCASDAACANFGGVCDETRGQCITTFCNANRCAFTPVGSAQSMFTNTATATARAETPFGTQGQPRPVEVRATVVAATPRTGTSDLTVRFEKPKVIAIYPTMDCQQACPNSRVVAVTNVDLLPATVVSPATNVRLYKCPQENCRTEDIVPGNLVSATVAVCARDAVDNFCRMNKVGQDSQIIIFGTVLATNTSYRVVVAKQVTSTTDVPLTELNYPVGDSNPTAYSWTFRTRGEQCAPSRIELSPNPLTFTVIGERATVAATPFSAADLCSPAGQPLDLESLAWSWTLDTTNGHVARFTAVTATGTFPNPPTGTFTKTTRVAGPSCTLACMVPGSRRLPGICGNGVLETPAEECEPNGGNTLTCDATTCLWKGARPIADGGMCGNGAVDAGEECDKLGPDGQLALTGEFPKWCDSTSCLRKGAGLGSVCGNGNPATPVASAGDGEDCDDGNTNNGDGCSSRCLAEGTPVQYHATNAPNGILARCGDGIVADGQGGRAAGGEECDVGSQARGAWTAGHCDFDRCVKLGTEPIHHACLGGTEQGAVCGQNSDCPGSACETVGQCGNGAINPGEQCDDGMVGWCNLESANAGASCAADANCTVGTPQCVARRCTGASANAGDRCATDTDCTAGTPRCADRQPVDGDGCSSVCLREGASITWRNTVTNVAQPSMCGDGRVHTGEMCDLGSVAGTQDAMQIVQAIGGASAVEPGLQAAEIRTTVNGVPGTGRVELQCGYERDAQCPNSTTGVDRQGCCRPRPTIAERLPSAGATGVCRNAQITVRFSENMDPGSVGKVTDATSGATRQRGAVLERCRYQASCGTGGAITPAGARVCKLAADVAEVGTERRCTNDLDCTAIPGTRCHDSTATWEETAATPVVLERELSFMLARALDASTKYRVRVYGITSDTPGAEVSIRSLEGTRFGTTSTSTFTTSDQVCTINRIEVTPPSYLLQRRESRAPLRASAIARTASGDQPIVPVSGAYTWGYTWAPSVGNPVESGEDITTTAPNWTDPKTSTQYACAATERCAFKPAEPAKNGDTFATATASVALNIFAPTCVQDSDCTTGLRCVDHGGTNGKHCVGESYSGRSQLRAFICENPWPEVTSASTWLPYEIAGERISVAYCRDQGEIKVCRDPDTEEAADAKTCAEDSDCTNVVDTKCLPALRDDLPAFGDTPVTKTYSSSIAGTDELRKEFFFLPRGVSYCSVSGERCDPTLAGVCPAGEFCRAGQDAIGFRIYENERHVGAGRWFQQQGFTEATTPVDVDGYRGIRSGRSVYVNAANTGSVYTNLSVLSVNDGAVPETPEILNQTLAGIRFSTNLTDQNVRTCAAGKRCVKDGALCAINAHCPGAENRCDSALAFSCATNADCSRVAEGVTVNGGVCNAPKDKLQRDIRRLEDLNEIRLAVEAHGRGQARCSVTAQACIQNVDCPTGETCFMPSPELTAGSFLPGFTTSRWPSWATELGKALGVELPNDPLNVFGGACVTNATQNAKYDQQTCWNQEEGKYAAASKSYLYEYARTPTGTWA